MKKLIAILLAFCATFSLFATGNSETPMGEDNSLSYIQEKGEFVLGLDDAFPPMGFRDEDGKIVGFDIDLATEVFNRMGIELRLQPIDWDAKILDLNSKDIDAIWNGLTINEERQAQITFSKPYLANEQIIIVQAGSSIDTRATLSGKTVGIQLGSSAQDGVDNYPEVRDSFKELVKYQDNVQALMDLKTGRIDAVVVDSIAGRYYISQNPGDYQVASEDFAAEQFGVGFRKGNQKLANEVDRILDEMVKDGTAEKIAQKWFAADVLLPR